MGNLDDIFKDNFGAERSGLPADEENQLWDSIVDELGDENSIPAPKNQFFSTRLVLLLLFIAMIPLAFYLGRQSINDNGLTYNESGSELIKNNKVEEGELVNQTIISSENNKANYQGDKKINANDSKTNNSVNESTKREVINSNQLEEVSGTEVNLATSKSANIYRGLDNGNTEKVNVTKNETLPLSTSDPNDKNQASIKKNIASENIDEAAEKKGMEIAGESVETTAINLSGNSSNAEEGSDTGGQKDLSRTQSDEESIEVEVKDIMEHINSTENNELVNSSFIERMELLTFNRPFQSEKPSVTEKSNFEPVVTEDNKSKEPWKFAITAVGGANRSGINYSGSNAGLSTRKNNSERAYYGQVFGANISTIYNSKWIVNTGIHYEVQRTIYDESFNQNISRQVDDVAGILVNSQSYAVLDEYERDTIVTFSSVNKIKQINSFSSYSIPVQLGYQWNRNSFSYGILTGATLRIRTDQKGKLLDANQELVDLDTGLDLFYNSFNVGINASPFIEYHINNNWSVLANYDIAVYKPVVSLDQSLELYNSVQTLKIGLRYYLK